MTKIFFDEPSEGGVNDPLPALTVSNHSGVGVFAYQSSSPPTLPAGATSPLFGFSDVQATAVSVSLNDSALIAIAPKAIAINAISSVVGAATVTGINIAPPVSRPPVAAPPSGYGVLGYASGRGDGVVGVAAGMGDGVVGVSNGDGVVGLGARNGVRGESLAGPGVQGHGWAGPGVLATSAQAEGLVANAVASNAPAIRAANDSSSGFGVLGSSQNGIGMRAQTSSGIAMQLESTSGSAMVAHAMTGSGIEVTCDVAGTALKARSWGGTAVDAFSLGDTIVNAYGGGCAIKGVTLAGPSATKPEQGYGVLGFGMSVGGVYGLSLGGVGILGQTAMPGSYAGVFKGNVSIEGVLLKYASLFSIDHPLAPNRKRLNHAAVESSEYKTFYDGVTSLDARGRARIRMPRWFEALNGQLRYQLTPLGAPMPDLHIANELRKGVFAVAGGRAGAKISWQVTGVRRDRWARKNPLKVEQPKSDFSSIPPSIDIKAFAARAKKEADLAARNVKRHRAASQPTRPTRNESHSGASKSKLMQERETYLNHAAKNAELSVATAAKLNPANEGRRR